MWRYSENAACPFIFTQAPCGAAAVVVAPCGYDNHRRLPFNSVSIWTPYYWHNFLVAAVCVTLWLPVMSHQIPLVSQLGNSASHSGPCSVTASSDRLWHRLRFGVNRWLEHLRGWVIHKAKSPSAVIVCISTHRMPLIQSKCSVWTDCGITLSKMPNLKWLLTCIIHSSGSWTFTAMMRKSNRERLPLRNRGKWEVLVQSMCAVKLTKNKIRNY